MKLIFTCWRIRSKEDLSALNRRAFVIENLRLITSDLQYKTIRVQIIVTGEENGWRHMKN